MKSNQKIERQNEYLEKQLADINEKEKILHEKNQKIHTQKVVNTLLIILAIILFIERNLCI